jgi:D-sedoheptulose 7-phosphate isomerase
MVPLQERLSLINNQIEESFKVKEALRERAETILTIAAELAATFRQGNKVLLCGNGGSAADAQHIAAELAGKFKLDRSPLPAVALTTNTSVLTALANDFGYNEVFSRQVRALAAPGDVVIGISTSGNSPNIILALEEAKAKRALAVAFTGSGGSLKEAADLCLYVPSEDTPRIQEAHITAGHIICALVEEELFGEK